MNEGINIEDIPYLEELLKYLPIDPVDSEDITTYIENIVNLIAVNYKYGQYQFAYFGIHLLYMTYIYCTVWKISKINPIRYNDAVLFARPYEKKKIDLMQIKSIFEYSNIPEKELPKIFKIININDAQIGIVSTLVDTRNNMAHASGKFEILTEENFNLNVNSIFSSIKNIHSSMDAQIRMWFRDILCKYSKDMYCDDYSDIKDIIIQEMIQDFNLSKNELLICNEMSVRALSIDYTEGKEKIAEFKNQLKQYCIEKEYIEME